MKNVLKEYLFKYSIIFIFLILSLLTELTTVLLVDGSFMIYDMRYFTTLMLFISGILFIIKNDKARYITAWILLLAIGVVNTIFLLLYEMTGQHFHFSMFSLRNDAFSIIDSIPLNFFFFMIISITLSLFFVFGNRLSHFILKRGFDEPIMGYKKIIIGVLVILTAVGLHSATAFANGEVKEDKYIGMLTEKSYAQYKQYGATSNFLNEVYNGLFFNKLEYLGTEKIDNFLYGKNSDGTDNLNEVSKYFGVSEGNNVITILGETFEWFTFINDQDRYPNGLELSEETLRELFPNTYYLYDNSLIFNNHYVREKTDVSEIYTNLGSYPNNNLINYNFADNTMPNSVANILRELEGVEHSNSFHNGYYDFYNRDIVHNSLGYKNFYATEQFTSMFPDIYKDYVNERNLDSEMFEAAKDLMHPTDERFYSYTLSITQHGSFSYRDNIKKHHDKLVEHGMNIYEANLDKTNPSLYQFYSYIAMGLDFEQALGTMLTDLRNKNLLEDTTIVIFGDHNAYYQGLTNHVKDLPSINYAENNDLNYLEIFRLPVMIYDTKLLAAMESNNESRFIEKFTTQSDIVPTLYDLLGIYTFENMFYGNSALTDVVSLSYSQCYDVFITEDVYFNNIHDVLYAKPHLDDKYKIDSFLDNIVKTSGTDLTKKIEYCDQIFVFDYFGNKTNYDKFWSEMKRINS